jgi:aspartate ammonia-lyase
MMPVMAWNTIHATRILRQAMRVLETRTVSGIEADAERCRELLDRSTAVATALSTYIGYAATAEIAKESVSTGKPVREIVRERKLIPDDQLERILSPEGMTSPGIPGEDRKGKA